MPHVKKDPHAVNLGRRGGVKSALARAAGTTRMQRQGVSRVAIRARWGKRRLALIRTVLGEPRSELARALGLPESRLATIESAQQAIPEIVATEIATRYQINAQWLITGRGFACSPEPANAPHWLTNVLHTAHVETIVILSDEGQERGVLVVLNNGVLSVRLGPIAWSLEPDPATEAYRGALAAVREWGGTVGRVIVSLEESLKIDDIDLSTLASRAIYAPWLLDDEAARLRPRGALYVVDDHPMGCVARGQVPVTPEMLAKIRAHDPELAAILELLKDSDLQTRAKVYTFLLTSRQAANALADQLTAAIRRASTWRTRPRGPRI